MKYAKILFVLLMVVLIGACEEEEEGGGGGSSGGGGTPPPTLTLDTSTVPDGDEGVAYTFSFQASGGTAPYSWASTGTLPTGLALSTSGVLSGTPTSTGSHSFSVTVTDSGTQSDTGSFTLFIQSAPQTTPGTFSNSSSYSIGRAASGLAVADFGTDGLPDIATGVTAPPSSSTSNELGMAITNNSGSRSFGTPVIEPTQQGPIYGNAMTDVVRADLNDDGAVDVVAVGIGASGPNLYVFRNLGTWFMASPVISLSGSVVVDVGDITGNGYPDIIVAAYVTNPGPYTSSITVYENDGAWGFTAATPKVLGTGTSAPQITALSFFQANLVLSSSVGVLAVERGSSGGDSFLYSMEKTTGNSTWLTNPTSTNLGTAVSTQEFAVADLDGDNKSDVVTANGNGTVGVFSGDGFGNFTFQSYLTLSHGAYSITASDLTNDGNPDIAVSHWSQDNSVSVLLNTGSFSFSSPANYAAGSTPDQIAAADFDLDGSVDLIVLNDVTGTTANPLPFRDATILYGD